MCPLFMKPPEAYEANQEEIDDDADAPVDSYSGRPYDTSLIHLYGNHVTRHVSE